MKTQEQKLKDTQDYLAKTAQHLFIVNDKIITKLVPFYKDENLYYAKLMISPSNVSIDIINANRYKWEVKPDLFPQYVKTKSIPYFKKMREIVSMVENEISLTDNKVLCEKIKTKADEFLSVTQ